MTMCKTPEAIEIVNAIESLDRFFHQFSLSVRKLSAKNIPNERYLRGSVDLIRTNIVPPSVMIERAFDQYKVNCTELQNLTMTFAGLQFIVK